MLYRLSEFERISGGGRVLNKKNKKINKKKGMMKFRSKTMCTHSKWENEQAIKTELRIPFYLFVIPVRND